MHILSRSFSQRRKSSHKRPRDLHIRKVSFSGCSRSSGCSFSSTSSTSTFTPRTRLGDMPSSASHPAGFDPLSLHPTFHAPPRLHDRPYLDDDASPRDEVPTSTFWSDSEDDIDEVDEDQPQEMELPPHASPMDHFDEPEPAQDYFFTTLSARPPLPRSHWSESTIQTIDSITPDASRAASSTADPDEAEDDASVLEMPTLSRRSSTFGGFNFGFKRNSGGPKRPPMKAMDSVDNFIKRGGWKRRGIVFNEDDVGEKQDRSSFVN